MLAHVARTVAPELSNNIPTTRAKWFREALRFARSEGSVPWRKFFEEHGKLCRMADSLHAAILDPEHTVSMCARAADQLRSALLATADGGGREGK